jgi:hypothetical protein
MKRMIERIYIPTVRRADNQITYDNLPDELKERVIMVVEPDERSLYNYPCDYLEIPQKLVGTWTQLAETRLFIHKHAGTIKYCIADDDIIIGRRNAKTWTGESNMEKSRRVATKEEVSTAFEIMDKWLDEKDIGITGFSNSGQPPPNTEYLDTVGCFSIIMVDGRMVSKIIDDINVTELRTGEDILFLFECLSRGINTRLSIEWLHDNKSMSSYKTMKDSRIVWTEMYAKDEEIPSMEEIYQNDHNQKAVEHIQKRFPMGIKIYEKNGVKKHTRYWKRVYKSATESSLESFL